MTPALPPGFQLETQPSGPISITIRGDRNSPPPPAAPPLPPGFQLESPNTAQPQQSIGDQLSAGFTSSVNALPFGPAILSGKGINPGVEAMPVIGPIAQGLESIGGLEGLKALVQGRTRQDVAATDQTQVQQNPVASTVGTVAGTVAPFVAGGEIPAVAKLLGMDSSVPLLLRSLASAGSTGAIEGADSLSRGNDLSTAAQDAGVASLGGALVPGAGEILGAAGSLGNKLFRTLTSTDNAASKVVSGAVAQDMAAGKAMTPADEAVAQRYGQPVINADRFGTNVRGLARTAANTDSTARQALDDTVQQRFLTQSDRAKQFVSQATGGNTDDLAYQEAVSAAARRSNRVAYGRSYADPAAQAVWTPGIKSLFQSPDFISAVKGAERTAANDAAANGTKAIKSPFVFDAKGNIHVRQLPGGGAAIPNLEFWDIVQRNLRAGSETAYARGDKLLGSQTAEIRRQLLSELDKRVPSFAAARRGAAAAFGAEDALDAGRKFASQPMGIPEARRAYAKFTPEERKAFATGYASSLIDRINAARDRVNVINQVFGSPAARAQVELALGKSAAAQLEDFTRIEDIMQMTKQAVQGNSTTAQQLIASGILTGGAGGALGGLTGGWNPSSIGTGTVVGLMMTAGHAGLRATGKMLDQKVMQRVAEMLSSSDPAALTKAVKIATSSPQFKLAVQSIERGLSGILRGGVATAAQELPNLNGASAPTLAAAQ